MTLLDEEQSVLMVIDIQERLLKAVFNRTTLEQRASIMVKAADILSLPVIVTEQYPNGLGKTVPSISEYLISDKSKVFEKTAFSALNGSEIVSHLKELKRRQVILFGIETHICVNQTASSLIDAGYEVYIVSDACGSRSEYEYRAGIARIKEHGARILTTEIALFELLRGAYHPKFKDIQKLIK